MTNAQYSSEEIILIEETLNVSIQVLEEYASKVDSLYYIFPISKGKNKKRWISAPQKELKNIHNNLLHKIFYKTSVHNCAHGFVPQRSIVTNARAHLQQKWVANFDIHSFFPSTKKHTVLKTIIRHFPFSEPMSTLLTELVTRKGELPQGAPTSPHLANLVMWDADTLLEEFAQQHELTYTRYADDLTFSGSIIPKSIHSAIRTILAPFGYMLAYNKSKILGQHKRQMVTGLVVNEKLNLPRPMRKRLRAIIHDTKCNGLEQALHRSDLSLDQFLGHLSIQHMWAPAKAKEHIDELAEALNLI